MTKYLTRNRASLYLGSLLCTGPNTDAATGAQFTVDAMAAGASWGVAEPIDVAVQRWMTDGAVVSTQGYENRQITFQVKLSATTSFALAMAEDALMTAAQQSTTLSWVPPEGSPSAATTVFDVWTCHLSQQFDIDEENRLTRAYNVVIVAKPWARSANLTTAPAVPTAGAGTVTQIDACTSTTGWTGSPNTPTVLAGTAIREAMTVLWAGNPYTWSTSLTRTGSVTGMGTTPYLALDMRTNSGTAGSLLSRAVTVDGAACTLVGTVGTTQYWQVPASVTSFTTLTITATWRITGPGTVTLDVYDVTKSSIVGSVATHKMLSRSMVVGGSVKTNGSIQVASPSATNLGTVLVYTCPDTGSGYSPPLRQYRVSGGTVTADATMVSGSRETTGTTHIYDIPAGTLLPGTYVFVGRLNFTATGSVNLTAATAVPGTSLAVDSTPATNVVASATGPVWGIVGALTVPGVAVPPESGLATRIIMTTTMVTGTATLDEWFMLDVTHGAFSLVQQDSPNFTFTRLWLDAPDADLVNNLPHIYTGANADRSDARQIRYQQVKAIGDHDLDPNGSFVFTVTDGVDDAAVSASFYKRWHTNAAE